MLRRTGILATLVLIALTAAADPSTDPGIGYYRHPAIHGDTIVFVAEGDLWRVDSGGGEATRLTSHPGPESMPTISPDGSTVAFVGRYEGPAALYTMPLAGGIPRRWTWDHSRTRTAGWTPSGHLLYATEAFATLPDLQLIDLDTATGALTRIPLAQASDGCYDDGGRSLYFTRYRRQGSQTKRYHGGTAQRLWRFDGPGHEAVPLSADFQGTSRDPMWWQGRLFFSSDRDGTMNIWSMASDGSGLEQHTNHVGWDVLSPTLSDGRIAYQLGADLRILDLSNGDDHEIDIRLVSDFDHTREQWVDEPLDYLTAAHISPDGERVVLTARGQAFVLPRKQGRLVEATRTPGVRYRDVQFMPSGEELLALSDESGEVELWTLPANGVGAGAQLTDSGEVLRWQAVPSPDGSLIAHHDKNYRLFILDKSTGEDTLIATSDLDSLIDPAWSHDGRWLAWAQRAENQKFRIHLYSVPDGRHLVATSDRYSSFNPAFSSDGKWLYFLSDRHFESVVSSPWGDLQPDPFFDKRTKIYMIALTTDQRSPFAPDDELHGKVKRENEENEDESTAEGDTEEAEVEVAADGLTTRLHEVPAPPANMSTLYAGDKALYWLERDAASRKRALVALKITGSDPKPMRLADDVAGFELSADGKNLLVRKSKSLHIVDATTKKLDLGSENSVDLSRWVLSLSPVEEWRQMFTEAWRLERDYFYDQTMHGVDWKTVYERYLPLVDRVRSRDELSDLLAQMASELAAIHTFVYGGDHRTGDDDIDVASLGAVLVRDEEAGGLRIEHIYRTDPDEPHRRSPLAAPEVQARPGEVITHINGVATTGPTDPFSLLRNQVGRQVLVTLSTPGGDEPRDAVVVPVSSNAAADLRYREWEFTRRLQVDQSSDGTIGYVHLRAMGASNISEWARDFYPVYNRQGLIVDVRHNRGGNIDSWIVAKLMRKVWGAWSDRVAKPTNTNMQYAFRGHLVVLCDAWTSSDGEAFLEAIRRLDMGPIIGTRTWGGGIWLTSSNRLVDRGIATAAEFGLFGPEGEWLVEADGVTPDITVDNLPHATFNGQDAQLEAAIELLMNKIAEEPVAPLVPPPSKDMSLGGSRLE